MVTSDERATRPDARTGSRPKSCSSPLRTSRGCRPLKRRTTPPTLIGSSVGSRDPGSPSGPNHAGCARRCPPFATCAGSCGRSPGGRIATSGPREPRSPPSTASCATACTTTSFARPMTARSSTCPRSATTSTRPARRSPGRLPTTWPSTSSIGSACAPTRRAAGSSWTAHPVGGAGGATWAPAETARKSRVIARAEARSPGFRGASPRARMPSRRHARPKKPTSRHVRLRGRRFQTSRRRTSEWPAAAPGEPPARLTSAPPPVTRRRREVVVMFDFVQRGARDARRIGRW